MRPTKTARAGHGTAAYYAILVAATFLMASSFIAGKILLAEGVPAFLLVGWRFVVAAMAAAAIVFAKADHFLATLLPRRLGLGDWVAVALIGVLQTALSLGLLFWAMETISPSTAAILLFTNPLWVALIGHAVLDEKLSRLRVTGLIVGILGVAFALGGGFGLSADALRGEFLGLGAALAWTTATIVNKRARLPIDSWALSFWQMLIGALALLFVAYVRGEHWPARLSLGDWGWFFWLAIPGSTASFGLWFLALTRGGATRSSGYLFLAPLFTVILSTALLHTSLNALQGLGGALVGLSLWLINQTPPRAAAVN
jgi:drug/metabolite transporter (DMT)-like permease